MRNQTHWEKLQKFYQTIHHWIQPPCNNHNYTHSMANRNFYEQIHLHNRINRTFHSQHNFPLIDSLFLFPNVPFCQIRMRIQKRKEHTLHSP